MKPVTLYLIGFAGSGKLTIAKEFSKFGYTIVDNHLINNPILSLINNREEKPLPSYVWYYIKRIRETVFEFMATDLQTNYVLTNVLHESTEDHLLFKHVQKMAEQRNSIFIPIQLIVTLEELEQRITNLKRAKNFKQTRISEKNQTLGMIAITHPHLKQIDITFLQPYEVAQGILDYVHEVVYLLEKIKTNTAKN